ncbi:hypothetical protein DFH05DRAFT_1560245 [Lentinula detonsa]|uniref:Serine protein kinase n=1 Tax=Lentinula detonsa TaxID=2804962 RepID=A0A9W8TSS7_9AGAR|nr:hypothetical protein DFH05DRAFT_1560245 [Lentinula detonsa]
MTKGKGNRSIAKVPSIRTIRSTISLPDDQSFRIIKLNQRTVILSVAENGVRLGNGTDIGSQVSGSERGFYVFAENVTLSDLFSVTLDPDATATISTFNLTLSPVKESTIDVSGAPGTDNVTGASPSDSINGKSAGGVCTYIENCTSDTVQNLVLKARGGYGGDTNQKQGTAGNGGNGGKIWFFAYSYITEISGMLLFFAQNKSWNQTLPGDEPLTPVHAIVVFLQQILDVSKKLPELSSSSGNIQTVTDFLKPIEDICQRSETLQPPTVDNARDAVWDARQAVASQFNKDKLAIRTYIEPGQGGNPAPSLSGAERGQPGKSGTRGTILSSNFVREMNVALLRKQTTVMVHPDQCKMLFDRAITYWYFGRNETAIDLLNRLLRRTMFLPLGLTDALSRAYTAQESLLGSRDSISSLVNTRKIAMQQNNVLQTGKVDFYGFGTHWVPRVSYTEYNDYISDAMNVFIKLEASYINYRAALDQQEQTNAAIQECASRINSTLSSMQEERKTLVESLTDTEIMINVSGPEVEQKHRDFMLQYDEFIQQVTRPPPKGISIGQLFNAALNMVKSGSKIIGAVEAISQLWSDFNGDPDHIISEVGVTVRREYLMATVKNSIATGLQDFTSELTPDELNGEFTLDGRVPKLILEEEKLRDIVTEYKNEAFAEAGVELLKAYDDFIQALSSRNDDIATYNSLIQRLVAQAEEKRKLTQMKELAQKGTLTNEDLEQMTGYIRMLFENARARVMRYLSMGQRALTFKILKSRDLLDLDSSVSHSADVPLSVTSDVLVTIRSNLQDLLLTATEENSGIPATFPSNWDTGTGKRRWLSADELKTYLSTKKVSLSIDPVFPRQKPSSLSSDFESSANVRVYRVRFYLQGLKAEECDSEPQMKAVIQHNGEETIISRRGVANFFDHSPLNTLHSYSVDESGRIVNIFDNGDLVAKTNDVKDSAFGAPGPFTKWNIDSSSAEWDGLDVSGVTSAYLEFFGTNYAFFS